MSIKKTITIQTDDEQVANALVKAIEDLQQEIVDKNLGHKLPNLPEKIKNATKTILFSLKF